MKALAFSNNDIAVFAWTFDRKLPGCLGFLIERGDIQAGTWEPLPAMASFAAAVAPASGDGQTPAATATAKGRTTRDAPVQKFWWKDVYARRGGLYRWRITPMGGTPGQTLSPLAGVDPLLTNVVSLTSDRGTFRAYFNRGIVATQSLVTKLGTPSLPRLMRHLADPTDPIRRGLQGQLMDALTALLDRCDLDKGEIRSALYELSDPKGLEVRLQAADGKGDPASRAVVLGNSRISPDKKKGTEGTPDADSDNRAALKKAGVSVVDRILPNGHIPHNKFLMLKEGGQPKAVLTGSTNWTTTGLCTQTNNALIIENAEVAQHYQDYWDQLEKDCSMSENGGKLQGSELRDWNRAHNEAMIKSPIKLDNSNATIEIMFSPNTPGDLGKSSKEPGDMGRVFELMSKAKQAVLFLAFDPGNNSILDAAGKALAGNPKLFVRGALTSTVRANNFADALKRGEEGDKADMHVAVVDEAGGTQGGKAQPDYRSIPATSVTKNDAFGAWAAEMHSAGHAIIHDKIVVIDPFSDDCVVVAGSHNLGWRASHNNDENFVIVRGHRPLAEAYACHVLDVYDHFSWRWWLAKSPETFGQPLEADDNWQDRYIKNSDVKSAEMRFWLGAQPAIDAHADAPPAAGGAPAAAKPPSGPTSGAADASHANGHGTPVASERKEPEPTPTTSPVGRAKRQGSHATHTSPTTHSGHATHETAHHAARGNGGHDLAPSRKTRGHGTAHPAAHRSTTAKRKPKHV